MVNIANIKRILVIRTDRIGDVILSTPVLRILRENFKDSFIAMMVSPQVQDVVIGNPYLSEVIVYDKHDIHKGVWDSIKFAFYLKRKKFDIALILHPTNRVNILTWMAGIPLRVGLDRKYGFLLTHKIPDEKYQGAKHEMEYTLDILRNIGLKVDEYPKVLFVPLHKEDELIIDRFFAAHNLSKTDVIIGIHPSASNPSRRWMPERFAKLADVLAKDFNAKIIIISGQNDIEVGRTVAHLMQHKPVLALGTLSLRELICLIKKMNVLVSNISGPAHIAAAIGTPVVTLFGQNEKGLRPQRWKPIGEKCIYIHKDVGCAVCLAHNCSIGLKCLDAISVAEVADAVKQLLKDAPR
ncbi:MAG: glycosyltransferase family 9 protein [Candidatus Omnitrophota bacterium]